MAALPGLADVAARYADAILDAVQREYPNTPRHVLHGPGDLATPRELHPAFYGCYDWHSAVEMHWALVRLLRYAPWAVPDGRVRAVVDEHLGVEAVQAEAQYLLDHLGWERPYGWGWAARLCAELESWDDDPDAARWAAAVRPLADAVTRAFVDWLPRVRYPERSGAHGNAAFALCRALPLARRSALAGDAALLDAISDAAVRWFAADIGYPAEWEPSGSDFLSPALAEAELIAEIGRPRDRFPDWLSMFLPHLDQALPDSLFTPAVVTDAGDGQGAHLHGLNLHRAYAFGLLAERLAERDPRRPVLLAARDRHAAVSLPAVVGERVDGRALAGLLRRVAVDVTAHRRDVTRAGETSAT